MKIWILKAVIQKGISFLPFSHRINFLFQKYVTKGVNLTDHLFEDKLIHCSNHIKYYRKYAPGKTDFTALEIGTGWYPIVPIGLYLCGASKVYTIDISSLLGTDRIQYTIDKYEAWYSSGRLNQYLPDLDAKRYEKLLSLKGMIATRSVSDVLQELNIYSIVGDARHIDLPDHSIDLINSNNTFEHIYPEILSGILDEFKRILAPDGVMSHQIDMSDHFAHLDKSITIYNFLQFSDSAWKTIDNDVQPQNRLRLPDHIELLNKSGFQILEQINRNGDMEALGSVALDDKFKKYKLEDIAVSHSLLLARNA